MDYYDFWSGNASGYNTSSGGSTAGNFWSDIAGTVADFFNKKNANDNQTKTAAANANAIASAVKGLAVIVGGLMLLSVILKRIFK